MLTTERPLEIDGNSKSNALLSPPLAFSSPLARHVTMPQLPSTPKIILEQRRASANEAIFESPIMYIPPSRPSMDESLLIWNSLTKKQVDQMLHEEMNREIDFSIRLKKQQEDVDQDSRKKKTKKMKTLILNGWNPAFKSDGAVCAVYAALQETTHNVLNSKIKNTWRTWSSNFWLVGSLENGYHIITKVLSDNIADIPYALIYFVEHKLNAASESLNARLIATTFDYDDEQGWHFPDYLPGTPEIIDLAKDADKSYNTNPKLNQETTTYSF
ncbi:hypothetical protein C2G38_2217785 [Gigaspora rosea]|uniref:Uncharacterized protein n=1 Tax=Gigaspora rosea TaxID=44941 RepID=A0A397U7C4_9GLOM|nr:hypothetical protein C2G38_2217785 [Gigaspora rosea]